jgi:hypothetical protein
MKISEVDSPACAASYVVLAPENKYSRISAAVSQVELKTALRAGLEPRQGTSMPPAGQFHGRGSASDFWMLAGSL